MGIEFSSILEEKMNAVVMPAKNMVGYLTHLVFWLLWMFLMNGVTFFKIFFLKIFIFFFFFLWMKPVRLWKDNGVVLFLTFKKLTWSMRFFKSILLKFLRKEKILIKKNEKLNFHLSIVHFLLPFSKCWLAKFIF